MTQNIEKCLFSEYWLKIHKIFTKYITTLTPINSVVIDAISAKIAGKVQNDSKN